MIYNVVMPSLGATGGEIVIEEWLVAPGQYVEAGKPLCVVSTDKATVEVEAFRSGYVIELSVAAGQAVDIGAVVARLADSLGESTLSTPVAHTVQSAAAQPGGNGRILASPIARRIARSEGLDLRAVTGTGRQAVILKRDVMAALRARQETTPAKPQSLSSMRRAIASRTQHSKTTIPHFYASITADMTEAKAFLAVADEQARANGWRGPTINDLILRAVALALRKHPQLNASWQDDSVVTFDDINLGVVIGVDDGMVIPVLPRADQKNLYTLAALTHGLKERALTGQLTSADLSRGTFTISNLGMFGLENFAAIINPPEAAILAVGAVREEPAVHDGQIVIRARMSLTLSVDHRVADGIIAARFLQSLKHLLENPLLLALEPPLEGI
jgi:pyruvate dehydrogenase E2 component (dihydrolipoamide acetyltransferase)